MVDGLKRSDIDITFVGKMTRQELSKKSSVSTDYVIENASVVWKFLKGRKLPGLMALDRVCFLNYKYVVFASFSIPLSYLSLPLLLPSVLFLNISSSFLLDAFHISLSSNSDVNKSFVLLFIFFSFGALLS